MKNWLLSIQYSLALAAAFATSAAEHASVPLPKATLKEVFKDQFLIGAALNQQQFTERDTRGAALIKDANKRDAPVISASSAASRDNENVTPYPRCGSGVMIQNIAPSTPSRAV